MKKIVTTFTILFITCQLFSQEMLDSNFFQVINIPTIENNVSEIDSSISLIQLNDSVLVNIYSIAIPEDSTRFIYTEYESAMGYIIWIEYKIPGQNTWKRFKLPTDGLMNIKISTKSALLNLDGKGISELIIYGEMNEWGTGGGTYNDFVYIFKLDETPKQLMFLFISTGFDIIGTTEQNFNDAFSYNERKDFRIEEGKIIIGKSNIQIEGNNWLNKEANYKISNVEEGTYKLINNKIEKIK